jgi:mannose-6-phosphate isomerase-like protein (cupin superfamily)
MSELKSLNAGGNYSHVSIGKLSEFSGKQFVKDATGASSCEVSFGTLEPGVAIPFFHSHKGNEENYIILSGSGKFQVDDDVFDVAEGSVIRVATNCDRCMTNTAKTPMLYICIQAKEGSLEGYTMTDAEITEHENKMFFEWTNNTK